MNSATKSIAIAGIVFALGCGTSPEQKLENIIEEQTPAAKEKLITYQAIQQLLADTETIPPLDDAAKSLPLNLADVNESYDVNAAFDTAVVSAQTLDVCVETMNGVPDSDLSTPLRFINHPEYFLMHCTEAAYVGSEEVQGVGWVSMEQEFKFLEQVKYVLVVMPVNYSEPEIVSFEEPKEFNGGSMECQVVLCDLEEKKILGGFTFVAGNSPDVQIAYDNATEAEQGLKENLEANVDSEFKNVLMREFTEATFPKIWQLSE